jgi:hypothetical protein
MSTISTHLNWGASYIVDDVYRRFISPDASEKTCVRVGRLSTVALIILASAVSLWLENALQAFQILLQIGAGTGLVFLLRWFWWRINAWSEVSAMIISFAVAVYLQFVHTWLGFEAIDPSFGLVLGVVITTVVWLTVTLATRPTDASTLEDFHRAIRPIGPGWRGAGLALAEGPDDDSISAAFACWFLGCFAVYGVVFGTGYVLYGQLTSAAVALGVALGASVMLMRLLPRVALR